MTSVVRPVVTATGRSTPFMAMSKEAEQLAGMFPNLTVTRAAELIQSYGSMDEAVEVYISCSKDAEAFAKMFPGMSMETAERLIAQHGSVEDAVPAYLSQSPAERIEHGATRGRCDSAASSSSRESSASGDESSSDGSESSGSSSNGDDDDARELSDADDDVRTELTSPVGSARSASPGSSSPLVRGFKDGKPKRRHANDETPFKQWPQWQPSEPSSGASLGQGQGKPPATWPAPSAPAAATNPWANASGAAAGPCPWSGGMGNQRSLWPAPTVPASAPVLPQANGNSTGAWATEWKGPPGSWSGGWPEARSQAAPKQPVWPNFNTNVERSDIATPASSSFASAPGNLFYPPTGPRQRSMPPTTQSPQVSGGSAAGNVARPSSLKGSPRSAHAQAPLDELRRLTQERREVLRMSLRLEEIRRERTAQG